MHTTAARSPTCRGGFHGLRLTADEYFALPDDGAKYELIDGVVLMSPSATPRHQLVALAILRQLADHVENNNLGLVLHETDVRLLRGAGRPDVVYRPEIIFITAERAAGIENRIEVVPDVVVEVISPSSRGLDTETKYADYERAGVREYWLIDPEEDRMTFYRLKDGRYVAAQASGDFFASEAAPWFRLDLAKVRAAFRKL